VNGQAAIGSYSWVEAEGAYLPFALDVLTLDGERIREITSFIVRSTGGSDPEFYARWPHHPFAAGDAAGWERFGLPARLG
jgi:hypothetical protein